MEKRTDLNSEERDLLERYRRLTERDRHLLRLALDSLAAREESEREQRF